MCAEACVKSKVPYMTTMAAALATANGILTVKGEKEVGVMSLQERHSHIQ